MLELKRETYDRCYMAMCFLGYEGLSYERVVSSKILTAHYYFCGMLAMAQYIDRLEAEEMYASFISEIDMETTMSLLPLSALLAHLYRIDVSPLADAIIKKGGTA